MKRSILAVLVATTLLTSLGCSKKDEGGGGTPAPGAEKKILIGLSLDTLKEERWQRDRDLFVKAAEARGAKVLVQAANSDDALQNSQAENLLTQGVHVLVVVPHNAKTSATIVESAHKMGVPVIAYDRLIARRGPRLLRHLRPDARWASCRPSTRVKHKPKGNYVLIGGAPTDNNALLVRKGQMNILQPLHRQGRHQGRGRPVGEGLAGGRSAEDHGERADPQPQPGGRRGGVERRHRRRRACRRWASRSCSARCWSPARTPTSPPASASWPAARP